MRMATPVDDLQELAARIRAARGYAGLNQTDLAQRLEIGKSTLQRWELGQPAGRGRSRFQRRGMAEDVAEALESMRRREGLRRVVVF